MAKKKLTDAQKVLMDLKLMFPNSVRIIGLRSYKTINQASALGSLDV